jgi:hypothetical protein
MMAFAEKLVRDATAITAGDIQGLRFCSKLLDALGAEPDVVYTQQLEDNLRRQLTVGRPISHSAVEQVPPAE